MKGSPMQRNFGIGESEAPDATSPNNFQLDSAKIQKALAAGMATLPGGFDAYGQSTQEKEEKEEETHVPKRGKKFKELFEKLFPEKLTEEEEEETDE
jgi:hypothetical protein